MIGVESGDRMRSLNDHETYDLVTIHRFGNMSEALMAKGCLESAGLECFLADANISRLEWPISRGMRLQVKAEDAEIAAEILGHSAADDSTV
jgi:Putative prokaryotic signal transducing protein